MNVDERCTHRFVIKGRLPGLNEMTREARGNKYESARTKRTCTMLCAAEAMRQKIPAMTRPIILDVMWVEPNQRRDLDNIAAGIKYILDGLQAANIIANDGWKDVHGIVHRFAVDADNPRIVVELQEV
jgi:Holliday junction resolvase RusA-like endonuclease